MTATDSNTKISTEGDDEKKEKPTETNQPYYFNANPTLLKSNPVEHAQQETPGDREIQAHLQKEFGEKRRPWSDCAITWYVKKKKGGGKRNNEKGGKTKKVLFFFLIIIKTIKNKQTNEHQETFEKYQFNKITEQEWPEEKDCFEAWPVYIYGKDEQGHPVLYDEIGCSTPNQVEKAFGGDLEKLRKFRFRLMRRLGERPEQYATNREKYNKY
ncbi:hypothetical protein RFI_21148, partial [Reticulomyxa filosa]